MRCSPPMLIVLFIRKNHTKVPIFPHIFLKSRFDLSISTCKKVSLSFIPNDEFMIFYTPDINGRTYTLNEEESGHAIKVLRLKIGDHVTLVDGRGGCYDAVIVRPHPKHCEVAISEEQHEFGKRDYRLHIGIAPTKNIERFEWFVEKVVEIGIDEITPLLCEHSERKHINAERIRRLMIAAMKQSQKAYLPQLNEMQTFDQWLSSVDGKAYIAYCEEGDKQMLSSVYSPGQDAVIVIGPEGDFSHQEITLAIKQGFVGISLGQSRLRTETAGVVACHSIYFMNQPQICNE